MAAKHTYPKGRACLSGVCEEGCHLAHVQAVLTSVGPACASGSLAAVCVLTDELCTCAQQELRLGLWMCKGSAGRARTGTGYAGKF